MRIGVDLMGSDSPPSTLFAAVERLLHETEDTVHFTLFAPASVLGAFPKNPRLHFQPSPEEITMEDEPLSAVRSKKSSSLVEGMQQLKDKALDAFVSAGNTGALIASATFLLPPLPHMDRPALLATLPKKNGALVVVDVGGYLSAKPEHLVQYAYLGVAYQKSINKIENPIVGLLNIGAESKKGTPEVREAHQILSNSSLNFVGNIEGQEVLQSELDVLVTDGFTGNVFLKTAEGVSSFVFETLLNNLDQELTPTLKAMQKQFHYTEYPGAILCGVEGLVVKCHGGATEEGIVNSIRGALRFVQHNLIHTIKKELNS